MSIPFAIIILLQALFHSVAGLPFASTDSETEGLSANLSTQPFESPINVSESLISRRGLAISTDGLCGIVSNTTCLNSAFGDSCSEWNFCGSYYKVEFAGIGCQADFGVCNVALAMSISSTVISTSSPASRTASTTLATLISPATTSAATTSAVTTSANGIVIVPVTKMSIVQVTETSTIQAQAPVTTLSGRFGFCGVSGSNCGRKG